MPAVMAVIALEMLGYIVSEGWPAFGAFSLTVWNQEIHPLLPTGQLRGIDHRHARLHQGRRRT